MPYSDPLCTKCLHPEELHSEVLAKLPEGGEVRRCTIGICFCTRTWKPRQQQQATKKAAQAH